MGSKTYKTRAHVLRKTKLAEKDLIVTMLDTEGRLLKGVAKGARKPGGSFAARLELFSEVTVLVAKGRSLDTICDAKLESDYNAYGMEQTFCASLLAELLCKISQPNLSQPRVFDIAHAAFARMLVPEIKPVQTLALTTASLWKVMSQIGFRPSFAHCSLCGVSVQDTNSIEHMASQMPLSVQEGGIVCNACPRPANTLLIDTNTIHWCEALIALRFDEIISSDINCVSCFASLQLARLWARIHIGSDLKTIDFLMTSNLFE